MTLPRFTISLTQQKYQYRINGDASYFLPLAARATLKTTYAMGYVSGSRLFQNELYQIGGFRLLRGFDEQSIFTNHYHMLSIEARVLLTQNSYAYIFSDNAWVQQHFGDVNRQGIYNGFGLGTTLETKNGIFSIALALGRNDQFPVQFKQTKIHFGYVAYF